LGTVNVSAEDIPMLPVSPIGNLTSDTMLLVGHSSLAHRSYDPKLIARHHEFADRLLQKYPDVPELEGRILYQTLSLHRERRENFEDEAFNNAFNRLKEVYNTRNIDSSTTYLIESHYMGSIPHYYERYRNELSVEELDKLIAEMEGFFFDKSIPTGVLSLITFSNMVRESDPHYLHIISRIAYLNQLKPGAYASHMTYLEYKLGMDVGKLGEIEQYDHPSEFEIRLVPEIGCHLAFRKTAEK
jgi:hypothetical protein